VTAPTAAVEKAIDDLPSQNKVVQLEAAKDQLVNAMQEQAKASGKPEAALAMELVEQIANSLDAQDAASAAATAAESGLGSELKATTKQEEVAEKSHAAAEIAAKRPQAQAAKSQGKQDVLARALNEAQQAATQAAKQTLDGDQPAAKASRNAAEAAGDAADAGLFGLNSPPSCEGDGGNRQGDHQPARAGGVAQDRPAKDIGIDPVRDARGQGGSGGQDTGGGQDLIADGYVCDSLFRSICHTNLFSFPKTLISVTGRLIMM
jgi:hypothetical protein